MGDDGDQDFGPVIGLGSSGLGDAGTAISAVGRSGTLDGTGRLDSGGDIEPVCPEQGQELALCTSGARLSGAGGLVEQYCAQQ